MASLRKSTGWARMYSPSRAGILTFRSAVRCCFPAGHYFARRAVRSRVLCQYRLDGQVLTPPTVDGSVRRARVSGLLRSAIAHAFSRSTLPPQ